MSYVLTGSISKNEGALLEVEENLRQDMSPQTPEYGGIRGLPVRGKYIISRFNVLQLEGYSSKLF